MLEYTAQPLFGFTLCIITYAVGVKINRRFKATILNPMLLASLMIIAILKIFSVPLENFMVGGDCVTMFLAPATAALAVSMYRQLEIIKKNWLPILVGCIVGAVSALGSIYLLCRFFDLSWEITASILPKSITTAFATKLSTQLGGIVPITMAAVFVSGLFGAVLGPVLIKIFRINNPVASGLAIGACSHALGTSKAIELGEVEGALSSIAVGLCGLTTVILAIFI